MAFPLYPSLIPRYVDESWFASDQPVDEAAKLNELEANHEVWIREAQYRNVDVQTPRVDPMDDDANEEDDEEEMNEDDEEDDEDMEEGEDIEEELNHNDSPQQI